MPRARPAQQDGLHSTIPACSLRNTGPSMPVSTGGFALAAVSELRSASHVAGRTEDRVAVPQNSLAPRKRRYQPDHSGSHG